MITFDADRIGPWVGQRLGWPWVPGMGAAIGKIRDGQIVAGIVYERYNGACVTMHLAGSGNWLDRTLLWMAFDYPFRQLGVKRITAPVAQSNVRCRQFIEHVGFELEAILHDAYPDGNLLIYKMLTDQCRYKDAPNEQKLRKAITYC